MSGSQKPALDLVLQEEAFHEPEEADISVCKEHFGIHHPCYERREIHI